MSYLSATGQLTPEWRAKCESAINLGWQRVLTFETEGGGFDWYGKPPAKTILSAYGILMLNDMDKVYPIDRRIIERAQRVLMSRQQEDGSWRLDHAMHTWHQLRNSNLPLTAYVAWALLEADLDPGRAVAYLETHLGDAQDPYVLALCANALVLARSPKAKEAIAKLEGLDRWTTNLGGITYASGPTAEIEATALAALALTRAGSPAADRALTFLIRSKDPAGSWHSTQATILSIKALLESARQPRPVNARVSVRVNGRERAFANVSAENFDVMQQVNVSDLLRPGENRIEFVSDTDAPLSYQVFTRCYEPWRDEPKREAPLEIDVRYERSVISLDDALVATARLSYRGAGTFMVIVDLGIPAGFEPDASDFTTTNIRGLDKFTITGRQITLYFGAMARGDVIEFSYRLRPKYSVQVVSPAARAYEYYSPDREALSRPVPLEVKPE